MRHLLLFSILFLCLLAPAQAAFEDFTSGWTESDTGARIDLTTNAIEWDDIDRYTSYDLYFYQDYGAANFGDFTHQFVVIVTDLTVTQWPNMTAWQLANVAATTLDDMDTADDYYMAVVLWWANGTQDLRMQCFVDSGGSAVTGTSQVVSQSTTYYVTISRISGAVQFTIRTGSHTGSVVLNEEVTTGYTTTFRYLYMINSMSDTGDAADNIDGDTTNLNLSAGSTQVELYVNSNAVGGIWTTVGTTPWLDAQDQPTNYIYESGRNTDSDSYGFEDSTDLATIDSVYLYVYCNSPAETDFAIELNLVDTGLGPGSSWGWVNVDVSATLTTWTLINAATVTFDRSNNTNNSQVDASYLLVNYTAVGGGTTGAQVIIIAFCPLLGLMALCTFLFTRRRED